MNFVNILCGDVLLGWSSFFLYVIINTAHQKTSTHLEGTQQIIIKPRHIMMETQLVTIKTIKVCHIMTTAHHIIILQQYTIFKTYIAFHKILNLQVTWLVRPINGTEIGSNIQGIFLQKDRPSVECLR